VRVIHPRTPEHWSQARRLVERYGQTIRESPCFDDLAADLEGLHRRYGGRRGKAWIGALAHDDFDGVVLLEFLEDRAVLKRLYVEPHARGSGLGRRLVQAAIGCSRGLPLELETLDAMVEARALYASVGFVETSASGGVGTMRLDAVPARLTKK
jgi:carbonic anhydrase